MGRPRTGKIVTKEGKLWARVRYLVDGKEKEIWRKAENKTEARRLLREILDTLENNNDRLPKQVTFKDLADWYESTYLVPPQYKENRKIAGMRSYKQTLSHFAPVKAHFGNKSLKSITYRHIEEFRTLRMGSTTERGNERSIAKVNREMAQLRRVLNLARREQWITKNPFEQGDTLISTSDEKKRDRILTREEEVRLLAACTGQRAHLKPIVICALDTGMRQGEILKLRWTDINLSMGSIDIKAFNTKTMQSREVRLTERLRQALINLYNHRLEDGLVFGITSNIKHGFTTAMKLAGIEGLRFHDLRHTAATRLIQQGIPLQEVGRILGHTQANTTYRYVNANADTARRAAAALDDFHAESEREEEGKEGRVN